MVTVALAGAELSPSVSAPSVSGAAIGLLARAKAGDQQAFSSLFETHGRRIYALSLRLEGSVGAAEKLTRDIFLDVFSNLDNISSDTAFAGGLYRSAAKAVMFRRLKETSTGISTDTSGHRLRPQRHQSIVNQNR